MLTTIKNEMNSHSINLKELDNVLKLSKDSETSGFDLSAGESWIYPTNYPLRDYQFDITKVALFNNTLVSLPTGLGKTFIAAVVMYNFYRWYPMGKIIFMAPTRPLVKQQIDACYDIMGIPSNVTAEITGTKSTAHRVSIWKDKNVFFITPQILQNDLDSIPDLGQQIRCIVIDEAHKAHGRHAYCEVVRKLIEKNKYFRVLALSATPGNNFNNVKEIVTSLLISHIELRTDESPDVTPYIFDRSLETVVVSLGGKLQAVKDKFIQILDVYTRPLIQFNVVTGNCANLTKGKILLTMKDFKEKGSRGANYGYISRNLNICVTLYHGYELLIRHGLRSFLSFFEESISKPLIKSVSQIHEILDDIRTYLGPPPSVEMLPDGTVPEIDPSTVFGHPKYYKLGQILLDHFKKTGNDATRVMVFCEYRESVMEAYTLLLKHRPFIRPRIFIGQGGITQAQQIMIIKMFRSGVCNTLVCTCIGEEGLDVGEVDLIVCFDISSKSPIRMVQRMGRTGRKRDGRVVVLVTEGKEQQMFDECMRQKSTISTILTSNPIKGSLYKSSPRMIPADLEPECNKMHITVNKKNTILSMFGSSSSQSSAADSVDFSDIENVPSFNSFADHQEMWSMTKSDILSDKATCQIELNTHIEKQRSLQPIGKVEHTLDSQILVSLLQRADILRFNLPSTQTPQPTIMSQIENMPSKKKKIDSPQKSIFKQKDIRDIFKNISKTSVNPVSTQTTTYPIEDTYTLKNITNTILKFTEQNQKCKVCENLFNCTNVYKNCKEPKSIWVQPETSVFNNITSEALIAFGKSLNITANIHEFESNASQHFEDIPDDIFIEEINESTQDDLHETLNFLKLDSIEDIFIDDSLEEERVPIKRNLGEFELFEDRMNDANKLCTPNHGIIESKLNEEPKLMEFGVASKQLTSNDTKLVKARFNLKSYEEKNKIVSRTVVTTNISKSITTNTCSEAPNVIKPQLLVSGKDSFVIEDVIEESNSSSEYNIDTTTPDKNIQTKTVNSDFAMSPVLSSKTRMHNFKSQAQRKLFSQQSSTPNTNTSTQKYSSFANNADAVNNLNETKDVNDIFDKWDDSFFDICTSPIPPPKNTIDKTDDISTKKDTKSDEVVVKERKELEELIIHFDSDDDFDFVEKKACSPNVVNDTISPALNKSKYQSMNSTLLSLTQIINVVNNKTPDIKTAKENLNKSEANCSQRNKLSNSQCSLSFIDMISKDVLSKKNIITPPKDDYVTSKNIPETSQSKFSTTVRQNTSENSNKSEHNDLPCSQSSQSSYKDVHTLSLIDMIRNDVISKKNTSAKSPDNPYVIGQTSSGKTQRNASISPKVPAGSQKIMLTSKIPEDIIVLSDGSEDDEDFVAKNIAKRRKLLTTPSPKVVSPRKTTPDINPLDYYFSDSDDDFASPSWKQAFSQKSQDSPKPRTKKIKKSNCGFLDTEAEVEEDEHYTSDSAEEDGSDKLEASFINDTLTHTQNETGIQAKYLQSIRSPIGRGKFKIPNTVKFAGNVFSQIDNTIDNTYVNDSFCVNTEDMESQCQEMSILEAAEFELEQKRKKRKVENGKKRKRIICLSSDSD